ncbi:unnamed protein product, partial [Porites evermanni]
YGLQCYKCSVLTSWDDCDKNKVKTTCLPGFDSCRKVFVDGEVSGVTFKTYIKDCTIKAGCSDDQCKALAQAGAKVNDCKVDCCQARIIRFAKSTCEEYLSNGLRTADHSGFYSKLYFAINSLDSLEHRLCATS